MNLRRKCVVLVAGLILSMAVPTATSAWTYTNCVNIDKNYSPTWHVLRTGSTFYAAQGEVVIRQLRGCTNSNQSNLQNYYAQVWPANILGVGSGTNEFKQIGYGNETTNGTSMNWFATCCSGGTDSVTGMGLTFYPVIGHTVRFSIYRYSPGGFVYWRLKVDDLSHAGWYGWRDLIQVDNSVAETWYGLEDHSKQSQFGSNASGSPIQLRGLSYRLSDGGPWHYLEGDTGISQGHWASDLGLGVGSCWIESVTIYNGPYAGDQTSVNGYTANNTGLAPIC
ncbi:MAG: hypothetical protein ACRDU4_10660 [Mycobacterium sp.]